MFKGKNMKLIEFMTKVQEAVDFEANILPRMMFNGKTSREVYDSAKSYTEEEKKAFLIRLLELKAEMAEKKEQCSSSAPLGETASLASIGF